MTAPLTGDDRRLLAAVLKYLRANGWQPAWTGYWNRGAGLRFRVNSSGWAVLMTCDGLGSRKTGVVECELHSVTHAVDLGVAFGLLPLAFSSAYRAGLAAAHTAVTPRAIPGDYLLALLRQANGEDGLDVAEGELLEHGRTDVYRRVIESAWIAAQAEALGWQVEANDLGDRLLVLDQLDTEEADRG